MNAFQAKLARRLNPDTRTTPLEDRAVFKTAWPTQVEVTLQEAAGVPHTLEADILVEKVAFDAFRANYTSGKLPLLLQIWPFNKYVTKTN